MGRDVRIRMGVITAILFACFYGLGQQVIPALERKVTVSFENTRLKEALYEIESKAQISFAYKTGIFDENQLLNRAYINKTVREVINDIFRGTVHSSAKGNYVLLKLSPQVNGGELVLEGYIIDDVTKEKIPYATIYDVQTLSSAISDEYGHYLLKLKKGVPSDLKVKKAAYEDADLHFEPDSSPLVSIYLKPLVVLKDTASFAETVDTTTYLQRISDLKWLRFSPERTATIQNFSSLIKRKFQFSVLPTIGTHGKLSSAASVNSSFNLLGGIVGSVNGFELGGLFNIDLDSVRYGQIAGLFNAVGGNQKGAQIGGLFNVNLSDFQGVQIGGIANVVRKNVFGVQIGGISNVVKEHVRGVQIAGINNLALNTVRGVQLAGIDNLAPDSSLVIQISGIHNHLGKNSRGVQIAGISNVAEDQFEGVQISGLVNYARNMKGMQIGFINVNSSIKGVPVGFLSFSKKGLHQFEIATNEFTPFQIGFKTGVNHFYNSIFVSNRITSDFALVGIGYGLGTSVRIGERHRVFFDLQNQQLFNRSEADQNYLHRLAVTYQFQWREKFAIAAGPTLNVLNLQDINQPNTASISRLAPYHFYENKSSGGHLVQMWVGGFIAVHLF